MSPAEWNVIRARVDLIAEVLRLSDDNELDAACTEEGLVPFARRHGQSIHWIADGDVRGMIASRAGVNGWLWPLPPHPRP
jgi:hypothetical protein